MAGLLVYLLGALVRHGTVKVSVHLLKNDSVGLWICKMCCVMLHGLPGSKMAAEYCRALYSRGAATTELLW